MTTLHRSQLTISGHHVAAPLDASEKPVIPGMRMDGPAPGSPLPAPGARIGQYEIIRELGRGGMGAVYAARDTKLGRKVAIKFLSNNSRPELTTRFIIEAQATARCNHENIVVIYEVGEHGGNPFMVLEYLQGAPLTQLLLDGRKLPPARPSSSSCPSSARSPSRTRMTSSIAISSPTTSS